MKKKLILFGILFYISSLYLQSQEWQPVGEPILSDTAGSFFGYSLDFNNRGNFLIVGEYKYGNSAGAVTVYNFNGNEWVQVGQKLYGETNDQFGYSVDINSQGNIIAIGACETRGYAFDTGYVQVFTLEDNSWVQIGSTIRGTSYEAMGNSICLNFDGTELAIGSFKDATGGNSAGKVQIFEFDGTDWIQKGSTLYGTNDYDNFGSSVDFNSQGNILAIGASKSYGFGYAKVFQFDGNDWIQLGDTLFASGSYNGFARDLKLNGNGNILAIGTYRDNELANNSGSVQIFSFDGTQWNQMGSKLFADTVENAYFGYHVDLNFSGNILVASGNGNNLNANNGGLVRVYKYDDNDWQEDFSLYGEENNGMGNDIAINENGRLIALATLNYLTSDTPRVLVYKNTCTSQITTDTTICFEYTSPSGNHTYTESGIYNDTIFSSLDCDTIFTINLTVLNPDSTITQIGDTLISNDTIGSYVWFDCDSNIVVGTDRMFVPQYSGNFAVTVDNGICSVTSECINFSFSATNGKSNIYFIYPNPTKDFLTIKSDVNTNLYAVLYDINGKILDRKTSNQNIIYFDLTDLPTGIYILKIHDSSNIEEFKIIKK